MQTKAISSVYGRIEELAIALSGEISEASVKESSARMLKAFSDRTKIVVLGKVLKDTSTSPQEAIHKVMKEAKIDKGHYVVLVDANHPLQKEELNIWIEDPFCALNTPEGFVVLLEPYFFQKAESQLMAEQISNGYNTLIKATDLKLEGGNLLVGDDYMLIGKNTLYRNLSGLEPGSAEFETGKIELELRLKELFGVNYVIWTGLNKPWKDGIQLPRGKELMQPLFHLDMFVTLGGKSFDRSHQGDELIFIAEIDLEDGQWSRYVKGIGNQGKDGRWKWIKELKKHLDDLKTFFENYHLHHYGPQFHVVRLPLKLRLKTNPEPKTEVFSFNNCLTEWYRGIRRVYLPDFGAHPDGEKCGKCLQCETELIFEGLGFRVRWVEAFFQDLVSENGALNCMTKVLKRSEY